MWLPTGLHWWQQRVAGTLAVPKLTPADAVNTGTGLSGCLSRAIGISQEYWTDFDERHRYLAAGTGIAVLERML